MSLLKESMKGIEKHERVFNKWAEKAYSVLGNITQCGIIEVDRQGNVFVVANRPDYCEQYIGKQGYLLDGRYTYSSKTPEGFSALFTNSAINHLHENEEELFGKKFDLWDGFSYSDKIDDNTHRHYVFTSDTPEIYDALLNNTALVRKFIKYFKENNDKLINGFKEHKFNLAEKKENYFVSDNHYVHLSEREKFNQLLQTIGVLDKKTRISPREWQCIKMLECGKSASQTGDILGISQRTVETFFDSLKHKLKVNSKSEIIETLK